MSASTAEEKNAQAIASHTTAGPAEGLGADCPDYPVDVPLEKPLPVGVRYYSDTRYWADIKGKFEHDQYVRQHSNGLCILGLAEGHPIRYHNKTIKSISFRKKHATNKPSGKRKLGAAWFDPYTPVCDVNCEDGSSYILYGVVRGNLYQVNPLLLKNPQLLTQDPETDGFLAIVAPKISEKHTALQKLMTLQQYRRHCQLRHANVINTAVAQREMAARVLLLPPYPAPVKRKADTAVDSAAGVGEAAEDGATPPVDDASGAGEAVPGGAEAGTDGPATKRAKVV